MEESDICWQIHSRFIQVCNKLEECEYQYGSDWEMPSHVTMGAGHKVWNEG